MSSSNSSDCLRRTREYIESRQRDEYKSLGAVPRDGAISDEQRKKWLEQYGVPDPDTANGGFPIDTDDATAEVREHIATVGATPTLEILASRVRELKAASVALGHGAFPDMCFGLMPSGPLSAHVELVKATKGYAVFVPASLFGFLNLASKLVVLAQPLTPSEDGPVYLPTAGFEQFGRLGHPYLKFRHYDLLRGVFVHGSPLAALPYMRAIPFQNRFVYLLLGAELFVLAHELAHVVLGHFDRDEPRHVKLEFEADQFAFRIVVKHFELLGAGNALERAYLCGFLVLTMIKVWEKCVRHLSSQPDDAVLDPHHPGFDARFTNYSETLKRLAIGRNDGDSILPGLQMIHNAISMIDMATTPEVLARLAREGQKKGGFSALALGQVGENCGKWQLPPHDVWNETVAELAVTGTEYEQALARWFVLNLGPGFELIYYKSLLYRPRNPEKERLFRDTVFSLQPLYRAYLPRLKERFQEEAAKDALEEYLHRIAGTLGFKAALDYGGSLELDPMDPGFGRRLDSTDE